MPLALLRRTSSDDDEPPTLEQRVAELERKYTHIRALLLIIVAGTYFEPIGALLPFLGL